MNKVFIISGVLILLVCAIYIKAFYSGKPFRVDYKTEKSQINYSTNCKLYYYSGGKCYRSKNYYRKAFKSNFYILNRILDF